jgi:hypothetical protein
MSRANDHYRRAAAKKLAGAFSAQTSSTLAPGTKVSAGGLTVESMKMGNFVGDQRVTTEKTPYADIIVKSGTDQDLDFMVGRFEQTWEHLRSAGDQGVEYFIEVIVGLSAMKRNRVVRIVLNSPESVMPDVDARTVSSHLEAMQQKKLHYSKQLDSWNFFFAEPAERFNDEDISKASADKNIQVSGLVRLIGDICERSGKGYVVTGNPVIRCSLESSAGIVMRGSHIGQPFYDDILHAWLYDMIDFTSGEGRERLWNPERQRFEFVGRERARKRNQEAFHNLLNG